MSVTRTLRDRLAEIEAHDLTIVGLQYGRHVKVGISAADGRTMLLILSKTPSDRRAAAKVRAQLRRFARQEATP
jgi:hypothetical protein